MVNKTIIYCTVLFCKAVLPVISILLLLSCRDSGQEKAAGNNPDGSDSLMIYIGSYSGEDEPGIYLFKYDIPSGNFDKVQEIDGLVNPSFLAVNHEGGFLYAVNETAGLDDENSGSVTAFAIDKENGKLSFLNRQSSRGAHPCHISLIAGGRFVAVTNYSGGSVAVLPVADDGSLQKATGYVRHRGSGPNERRQASPHAHSVYPHNQGSWIFAADLGIDRVLIYKIDEKGNLTPNLNSPEAIMNPGAGPRHLAIHPNGKWIYVVNELNSTVTRLLFDKDQETTAVKESVSTLPKGYEAENYCADIHVHPGGRFLYVSNRGHNTIAIFELTGEGVPVLTGHEPVRGEWPRNFNVDPSGRLLFVASQNSGNITVFDIDRQTGLLNFREGELKVSRPVCIKFL